MSVIDFYKDGSVGLNNFAGHQPHALEVAHGLENGWTETMEQRRSRDFSQGKEEGTGFPGTQLRLSVTAAEAV